MKSFMSPKILLIIALIFSVLIICFNVFSSTVGISVFKEYSQQDIEDMGVEKININTATKQELKQIPGLGDVISQEIIDYREEHGPYKEIEDLLKLKTIAEKRLDKIRYYITV